MLGKLTGIFTTAKPIGVVVRDLTIALGSILTILGVLGILTPEQVAYVRSLIDQATKPEVLTALGVLMTAGMSIYRTLFRSSSDKAAEAAKLIDAKLPKDATVVVKTALGLPDIVVRAK